MKIKIFALTHKKFEVPQDKMCETLVVKVGVFILPISAEQKEKLETEILKDMNA